MPLAPAGEQNAPGVTIDTGVCVGDGVGVGTGIVAEISNSSDFFCAALFISPNALTLNEILNDRVGVSKQDTKSSEENESINNSVLMPEGRKIPPANLWSTVCSINSPLKHLIVIFPGVIRVEFVDMEKPVRKGQG